MVDLLNEAYQATAQACSSKTLLSTRGGVSDAGQGCRTKGVNPAIRGDRRYNRPLGRPVWQSHLNAVLAVIVYQGDYRFGQFFAVDECLNGAR